VNDTALFMNESKGQGGEDRIAEVKDLVIKFKNKYSYDRPPKGGASGRD